MKSLLLLFGFLFIICFSVTAQKKQTDYIINSGQKFLDVLPLSEIYEYPNFEEGTVIFKDNTNGSAKMNYHLLFQQFLFIEKPGDTVALASPQNVKLVKIKNDEFYFYSNLFLKQDTTIGIARILTARFFEKTSKTDIGSYGAKVDSDESISQAYVLLPYGLPGSALARRGQQYSLSPEETLTLTPRKTMMISDIEANHIYPLNKKNLYKIYNKQQDILKKYLSKEKVRFDSVADMITLLTYMKNATN